MRYSNLLLLVILFSCSKEKSLMTNELSQEVMKFELEDFPISKELNSIKYNYQEILNPHGILLKPGKLIVSSLSSSNSLFIIDEKSMELERSTGKSGVGPDEIADAWMMDSGLNDSTFWVYSFSVKEFSEFSLVGDSQAPLNKIRQRGDFYQSLTMNWLNKDQIISYQNVGAARFSVFTPSGDRLKNYGFWAGANDTTISKKASFILSSINQGSVFLSPSKKYLILAQVFTDSFELLDLDLNQVKKVEGPIQQQLEYTIEYDGKSEFPYVNPNLKNGYNNVTATNSGVFLVYLGLSDEEIEKGGSMSTDIFWFDFDGAPVAHYLLDRSIKSIAVNSDTRKIYAITYDEEPGIAVFDY